MFNKEIFSLQNAQSQSSKKIIGIVCPFADFNHNRGYVDIIMNVMCNRGIVKNSTNGAAINFKNLISLEA